MIKADIKTLVLFRTDVFPRDVTEVDGERRHTHIHYIPTHSFSAFIYIAYFYVCMPPLSSCSFCLHPGVCLSLLFCFTTGCRSSIRSPSLLLSAATENKEEMDGQKRKGEVGGVGEGGKTGKEREAEKGEN